MQGFLKELNRQLEIKLFIATFMRQLGLPKYLVYSKLRLSKYEIHALTEREKMTRQLWFGIMNHYHWRCACCGLQNLYNKNPYIEKMEVDHRIPIAKWGLTVWSNLQVLCRRCNRIKGTGPRCTCSASRAWL